MAQKKNTEVIEQVVPDNNVDKIREILFGGQMKDYEGRFNRVEERLVQEVKRLAQEMDDRFSSLEKLMRRELEIKGEQLQQERKERLDGLKGLEQSLQNLEVRQNERLEELESGSRQSLAEAREEFHDEIAILQSRLREQQEGLLDSLDQEAGRLRTDKVSIEALSGLFSELGLRLKGDFTIPGES